MHWRKVLPTAIDALIGDKEESVVFSCAFSCALTALPKATAGLSGDDADAEIIRESVARRSAAAATSGEFNDSDTVVEPCRLLAIGVVVFAIGGAGEFAC